MPRMHAFISHSSQDAEFAARCVEILEAEGIRCWIAPRDIPTGSSYATEILNAIEESRCVALIFTENANNSPHVLREVERTIKYRRPLVPLRSISVRPTGQFDYFLATLHNPALPTISDTNAPRIYARTVREFLARPESESESCFFGEPKESLDEAFTMLWRIATDLELKYRKACRDKVSDDEWIGVGALQVAMNEFLVANRRHFAKDVQVAAQRYTRSVERLANAARANVGSRAAEDFEITACISREELDKWTELYQADLEFDKCYKEFESIFNSRRRPPRGFFARLLNRHNKRMESNG